MVFFFVGLSYFFGESGIWVVKWRWGYYREEYGEIGVVNFF